MAPTALELPEDVAVSTEQVQILRRTATAVDMLVDVNPPKFLHAPTADMVDLQHPPVRLATGHATTAHKINHMEPDLPPPLRCVLMQLGSPTMCVSLVATLGRAVELIWLGVSKHLPADAATRHYQRTSTLPTIQRSLLASHCTPFPGSLLGLKWASTTFTRYCYHAK